MSKSICLQLDFNHVWPLIHPSTQSLFHKKKNDINDSWIQDRPRVALTFQIKEEFRYKFVNQAKNGSSDSNVVGESTKLRNLRRAKRKITTSLYECVMMNH